MRHTKLVNRINELKRKKRAVILAHNYQRPEIFEVADYIGDSLGLCLESRKIDCSMIIFSGVYFMAESAKILNPLKKVIIPDSKAGCALADMITAEALRKEKKKYSDAAVVAYINCTADVKAEADIICTSSNAAEIVRLLPNKRILFVPDKNLAKYVQREVPEKEIIPWEGYCPIHHLITADYLKEMMRYYPNAKIISHPECHDDVREMADYIISTTGMVKAAQHDPAEEFIVITECGMLNRLRKALPNKKFYTACSICFDMKKITLEKIEKALITEQFEVVVPEKTRLKACEAFEKMFQITTPNKSRRSLYDKSHKSKTAYAFSE